MVFPHSRLWPTQTQAPPVVAQLEAVFTALEDEPLLTALVGPTRRGPKGHSVTTLWRCFVAKYVLGLSSTAAFIRTLENNPYVAEACGVGSPDAIPHESTFSRFFAKLTDRRYLHLVKNVSRGLVRKADASLPGFGQRVALDSTALKAWSNGGKPVKSDPEAGWIVKKGTQGHDEFTYGYKLHLLVDCEHELPMAANVSPGNVHDVKRASNVLSEARFTGRFYPKYVCADKGYSSKTFFRLLKRQYRATPIVPIHPGHRRLKEKWGEFMGTPEWKALAKQRQSVERTFSRLKGQRSLNNITVRGLKKVTVHCYLAVIAMQASHFVSAATLPS